MTETVRVLYVDGAEAAGAPAALEREFETFDVTPTLPEDAAARLGAQPVDCVVATHDADADGLALFDELRGAVDGRPFVLLASPVDEALVREAVAAGVTDVLERRDDATTGLRLGQRLEQVVAAGRALDADGPTALGDRAPVLSDDAWSRILDTSSVGILVLDRDERVVLLNALGEEILGMSRADLNALGPVSAAFTLYDERGERMAAADRPIRATVDSGESRRGMTLSVERPDGNRVWLSVNTAPLGEPDAVEGVVLSFEDVTDEMRIETEFDETLRRVTDAFYALDEEWRFTYVNDHAETLLEREADDILGERIWDAFPDAVGTRFEAEYRASMAGQEPTAFAAYYEPLDGWFEVRAYPSETGISVYFRDVTDEREREERLRARMRQQEAITELGHRALAESDLSTLLADASRLVAETLDADYCELLELRRGRDDLLLREGVGWREELVGAATVDASGTDSQAAYTLSASEPVVVEDAATETRFAPSELHADHGVESGVSVIIGPSADPFGVLGAYDAERRAYEEHDVHFVRSVATILATAINRAERERELELYETIVESVDDGVYVLDERSRFVMVNEAFASMVGYSRAELLGRPASTVHSQEIEERTAALVEDARTNRRDDVTVRLDVRTADGGTVPVETKVVPFPAGPADGCGRMGVVRDVTEREQYEGTLTALHDVTRDLLAAETKADVGQLVVDAAVDVLDIPATGVYLFDDEESVLRPAAASPAATELFDELPTFGPQDTSITWTTFVRGEETVFDDIRESEHAGRDDLPLRSGVWLPLGTHGVFGAVSTELAAFDDDTRRLAGLLAANAEAALDRIDRETEMRRRDEELAEQNARLRRVNQINDIIREVDAAMVHASSRAEIETTVCERLTDADRFEFAWIGDLGVDGDELAVRARAGAGESYLDDISLSTTGDGLEPAARTAVEWDVTAVSNVADGLREEPWRAAALSHGFQSAVSVPLGYDDFRYGVLTVYAGRPEPISEMERAVLRELGETVGYAINAAETREALVTDSAVELHVRVRDPDDVLTRLAAAADCAVEFEGLVPLSDDRARIFFTARDADAERLEAVAADLVTVESFRHIAEIETGDAVEMTVTGPTVASDLVGRGAVVRSLATDGTDTAIVAELPRSTDVRAFVESLHSAHQTVDLVARRDRERQVKTRQSFYAALTERLTDRQREVLRTAYLSGFFEWPRRSTGEEVARSLGIAQPTFNAHLRTAERRLLRLLFDER